MSEDVLSLENTKPTASSGNDRPNVVKTRIGRHWIEETDKPEHVKPITGLNKAVPIKMHTFTSKGTQVCLKSRVLHDPTNPDPNCPWCLEKDRFDKSGKKLNKAKDYLLLLGYVFDRVGATREVDGNVYDVNPVCVLELVRGPEDVNIDGLKQYDAEGLLNNGDMYEMVKYPKELKKAVSITRVEGDPLKMKNIAKKFKDLAKDNPKLEVPKDIMDRFEELSVEAVRGLLVNPYNVDWNNKELQKMVEKPKAVESDPKPDSPEVGSDFEKQVDNE